MGRLALTLMLVAGCGRLGFQADGGDGDGNGSGSGDGGTGRAPTLWVIGGGIGNWGQTDPPNASSTEVYAAPINSDGTLGAWVAKPALPQPYVHANPAVVANGQAFILGQYGTTSSGAFPTVLAADLNGDATWATVTPLPSARGGYQALYGAATDGDLLFVTDASGSAVLQTHVIVTGGIQAWTTTTALPQALHFQFAHIIGSNLYVIGTDSGNTMMHIYYAPIVAGTGLGAWVDSGVTTTTTQFSSTTAWQSNLYMLGGTDINNRATLQVLHSKLMTDGTPGAFMVEAPLPSERSLACAAAGPNAVYVIGGEYGQGQATDYDTAYYALPAPDGSIGMWKTTTPMPVMRSAMSCFVLY